MASIRQRKPKEPAQDDAETPSAFLDAAIEAPHAAVNLAVASELRFATEDAVSQILQLDFKFTQNNTNANISLLAGFIACAASIGSVAYSYLVPFNDSKPYLYIGLPIYFVMSGFLFLFNTCIRKSTFFVGLHKDPLGLEPDTKICVSSIFNKYTDKFGMEFIVTQNASKSNPKAPTTRRVVLERSFGEWFDVDGLLVADRLYANVVDSLGPRHLGLSFAPKFDLPKKSK